jgi:hypothetical protein
VHYVGLGAVFVGAVLGGSLLFCSRFAHLFALAFLLTFFSPVAPDPQACW